MFAVAGWTLPASPAAQVEEKKKKPKGKRKKESKHASAANSTPVDSKRTAPAPQQRQSAVVVSAENVVGLYERLIEGKAKPESLRKRKRKEKKRGGAAVGDGNIEGQQKRRRVEEKEKQDGVSSPKKTLSEKKRERKARGTAPVAADSVSAAEEIGKNTSAVTPPSAPPSRSVGLTPLQQKMRAKLSGARFRHINETLYTTPSGSSLELFSKQPEMYQEYHQGFRQQVAVWPENPVDVFISQLQARAEVRFQKGHTKKHLGASTALLPLPRDQGSGVCTVADLGCGDARIAAIFNRGKQKGKIKVLSFDLQASTPDVTVADIAHLPLEKESVDIAVFCLALMGTNFLEFVEEAYRILRWRGELWVAEIKSRFHQRKDQQDNERLSDDELLEDDAKRRDDEMVYRPFVEALQKRGFTLRGQVDAGNKMFVRMEFVKMLERERQVEAKGGDDQESGRGKMNKQKKKKNTKFIENGVAEKELLKPCVYKLR